MATVGLPAELLHEFAAILHDVNAQRYLSAIGLVCLLYDHLLTFDQEVKLVWGARNSFARNAFLLNRYIVPVSLTLIAVEMCGFSGIEFTNMACRALIASIAMIGICSLGMANVLILLQVVMLWEGNKMVTRLMTFGFMVSFIATCSTMITTLIITFHHIEYSSITKTCVITQSSSVLIAVWASPMLFEVLVLVSTCWNALQRPRNVELGLTKVLQRDGILFFFTLTVLRSLNLAFATTRDPRVSLMTIFFVWSFTTIVLNRSLLRIRRAEIKEAMHTPVFPDQPRGPSPFGAPLPDDLDVPMSPDQFSDFDDTWKDREELELGSLGHPVHYGTGGRRGSLLKEPQSQWFDR